MKIIKRTLAVLLTLLMLISAVPLVYATSKTATEAINWVKAQEGKALDYDGQYGAQCVDLAMYYYKYLGVSPAGGNGKDYATNALPSGWKRIKGGTPQKGDLLVYSGTSSNEYGHVAILESKTVIWHGRYNGVGKVQKTTTFAYNDLSNYWGCIHPNFASDVTVTFNGNGGTPSKASETFVVGQEYGDAFPTATGKEGYSFDGWYTSASGGTRHIRSTLASSGVTKLYAHWIKNSANVLKVNHIYKIYNEKSKLPWQVASGSSGTYVCQQEEKAVNGQLWRVTYADGNGYYKFENLQGLNALDMNANNKYGYRNHLQVYTPHGNDSQTFSLVYRTEMDGTTGLYTIHSKNSGRVVNVNGASLNAGAELNQWDYHGYGQRFYFVEQTERRVFFFDNLNNNYLPSPREVYEEIGSTTPKNHYSSRDTSYVTVSINPTEDSLTIKQLKAGSTTPGAIAGDMKWIATLNGSYAYEVCKLDNSTLTLHFKAKSSVAGAKMYFRWGYDAKQWYPVTLTTSWADYSIDLPRDQKSGNNLHPLIDKVCTVEMKEISMYDKGETGYIGDTDTFSVVRINADVYNAESCYTPLPTKTKEGYSFDGWYTNRVGGTKVADGNDYYDVSSLNGHTNLYAHWIKNSVHVHEYNEIVKEPTCTEQGYTTYVCSTCGDSYSDNYVKALGHNYNETVTAPTCTEMGYTTFTCARCGDVYTGNEVEANGHQYVETFIPETCTSNGYTNYQCIHCSDNYQVVISPLGHQDANDDGYCDICNNEIRPHEPITDPTNPTNPTNPTDSTQPATQPTTQQQQQSGNCKYCGGTHTGFPGILIGFFHSILALFGLRK